MDGQWKDGHGFEECQEQRLGRHTSGTKAQAFSIYPRELPGEKYTLEGQRYLTGFRVQPTKHAQRADKRTA